MSSFLRVSPGLRLSADFRRRAFVLGSVLLLSVALLSGCASTAPSGEEAADQQRTTVRVDNQGRVPVVVYALRFGQRRRLGRVGPYSEQVLDLPPTLASQNGVSLRFLIDPLGNARVPVTREIVVYEGDEVSLQVPPI